MKLLGGLAQGSVVLLDEVPTNLILLDITITRGGTIRGLSRTGGSRVLLSRALVLVLLSEAAIGRHRCTGM